MSIQTQISTIRSQSEEIFYALSASMDKEQGEKMVPELLKICIKGQIDVHKMAIELCDKTPEYMSKPKWGNSAKEYRKGVLDANMVRKQSHEDMIRELNDNLGLVKLL